MISNLSSKLNLWKITSLNLLMYSYLYGKTKFCFKIQNFTYFYTNLIKISFIYIIYIYIETI